MLLHVVVKPRIRTSLGIQYCNVSCSDCYIREFCNYKIAGSVVKDQATADPDTNLKQRTAMAVGSAAGGIKDTTDNEVIKVVAKNVEKGANKSSRQVGR